MLIALIYSCLRLLLDIADVRVRVRSPEAELLLLRHELRVLRRQIKRPQLTPAACGGHIFIVRQATRSRGCGGHLVRRDKRCAGIKTGLELGMRETYTEGVATHGGPEPCATVRKDRGEALDRGRCRLGD